MKRLLTCALTLAALLALIAPARADLLWEPYGNQFYETHGSGCKYVGRSYYANGEEGFVTLWDAPNGYMVEGQYQNGFTMSVYWQYEDWGCAAIWGDEGEVIGWVPMSDLELIYDYISFAEEYAERIKPYDGEFADYDGGAAGVAFYEYPGAPEVVRYWDFSDWKEILSNLTGSADQASYIQSVFVDENGLTWGFVGYMYGRMNAWFCLDDPEGDGKAVGEESVFPVRQVDGPELIPARPPVLPAAGYVPYILVGAVVAVTAVLLAVFFRKRKKKKS